MTQRHVPGFITAIAAESGRIAVWTQAGLAGLLLIFWVGFQYRPVIIDGASMTPAIQPGTVVLLAPAPRGDELVGKVVTFRSNDQLVTHRIVGVDDDGTYITKGDRNAQNDTRNVSDDEVLGVGRVMIPWIGWPAVWLGDGNWAALLAFGVAQAVVIGLAGLRWWRNTGRTGWPPPPTGTRPERFPPPGVPALLESVSQPGASVDISGRQDATLDTQGRLVGAAGAVGSWGPFEGGVGPGETSTVLWSSVLLLGSLALTTLMSTTLPRSGAAFSGTTWTTTNLTAAASFSEAQQASLWNDRSRAFSWVDYSKPVSRRSEGPFATPRRSADRCVANRVVAAGFER